MNLEEAIRSIRDGNRAEDKHTHFFKRLFDSHQGFLLLQNLYEDLSVIKFRKFEFPKVGDKKRPNADPVFYFVSDKRDIHVSTHGTTKYPLKDFLEEQEVSKQPVVFDQCNGWAQNGRLDDKFMKWVFVKIVMSKFYREKLNSLIPQVEHIKQTKEFMDGHMRARKSVVRRVIYEALRDYKDVITENMVIDVVRELKIDLVMES